MKNVGENIRVFREMRGFSQERMAKAISISQKAFSMLERGKKEITLTKLDDIAKALDVRVEDLLAFDSQKYFNGYNNIKGNNNGVVINPDLGEFKKLYEDKIALLEKLLERTESDLSRYRDRYGEL